MINTVFTVTAAAALAAFLPVTKGHMSMWHPSMYGFDESYEPVTPLANKPFNQWWFHGYTNKSPSQVMTIVPGKTLNIELACSKSYSTYGNSPSPDGCPGDSGSFHAGGSTGSGSGWWGNDQSNLMGCALAIAPKSRASQVKPEDFTVMSIQENCVRQRDTPFAIPDNLPACPDGECTCAWFWQGKNSAAEMYMIGFRCRVENGVATPFPSPAKPKRGAISGATQPLYWANDNSNLNYNPGWDDRPSYNAKFGWTNGAQTSAFGAGGSSPGVSTQRSSSSSSTRTAATSSRGGNDWTAPSASSSAWQGNNDATSSTSTRRERQTSSSSAWNENRTTSTTSSASQQPTQWNQHLAESEENASTTSYSTTSASPTTTSSASPAPGPPSETPKKKKVCRRGHVRRRSRSHT